MEESKAISLETSEKITNKKNAEKISVAQKT